MSRLAVRARHWPGWRHAASTSAGQLLLGVLGGTVLGLTLRLVLFALGALMLRALAILAARAIALLASADPVYTRAAVWSLSELRLHGLALGGPGLARVVVEPGSPVLARLVAAAFAHAVVLGVGLLLLRAGWLRRQPWLLIAGVAAQVQVALGVIGEHPSIDELESTGFAFAANALLPWLSPRGATLSDALTGASSPLLVASLVGLALLVGYVPVSLMLLARRRARSVSLISALAVVLSSAACAGVWHPVVGSQPAPAPQLAAGAPSTVGTADPNAPRVRELGRVLLSGVWDRWFVDRASAQFEPASRVEVVGDDAGNPFRLLVNGQPEMIRGMGLNTQYTRDLTPEQRSARLDSDFAAMRAMGVNTVLGWDPNEFDATLLDRAEDHGLGVIMPFEIDPTTDFTDPAVRGQQTQEVLDWVMRYRSHPALRMWGIGNEVLHKIVHPVWLGGPQDTARVQAARAFVDWEIETADAVHALDPYHPVTYRDAEDAFANWMVEGLHRHGLPEARTWFLWGTNCYTNRLDQIISNWPKVGMESPLWVSEFAPGGLAIPDRPNGFEAMWGSIRQHSAWTLGGAAYAWTRNGPEGVDRNLGLTDDGVPVDGRSLEKLTQLFQSEPN